MEKKQSTKMAFVKDVLGLLWIVSLAALGGTFKMIGYLSSSVAKGIDRAKSANKSNERQTPVAENAAPVAGAKRGIELTRGPVASVPIADFEVADRIIGMRLDPPVGVIHMRIYERKKLVRRYLTLSEPKLRTLLQGRSFELASTEYKEGALREIKDESVMLAEQLINQLGRTKMRLAAEKRVPQKAVEQKPAPRVAEAKPVAQPEKDEQKDLAVKQDAPKAQASVQTSTPAKGIHVNREPAKKFDARPTVGVAFEGILIKASVERVTPRGRDPYDQFQARLRLDNGVEVPLRGTELEREFSSMQINVGERVSITPMGQVPVTLPSGKEGQKNIFHVSRM